MKYVILADSKTENTFKTPRQLTKINGETLLHRTVRLLKQNNVKDILITSHDERFEVDEAIRYEPLYNDYDNINKSGYWLSAFPIELLNEPICFVWGDVYFSEQAIKTIVETQTDSTLFFCTYQNKSTDYIKQHDEPLAYKVIDYELFKKHIDIVKKMYDDKLTVRHPIVWELYRSINNQDINTHVMTKNYIAINDISCDIDSVEDIEKLKKVIGGKMIKVEVIEKFSLERFNELENLERAKQDAPGKLNVGDKFECSKELADYLLGDNPLKKTVVKVIEVKPSILTKEQKENAIPVEKLFKEEKKIKKSKKSKK